MILFIVGGLVMWLAVGPFVRESNRAMSRLREIDEDRRAGLPRGK